MKCPICDFESKDNGIRCPSCQTALTFWINCDDWAENAYAGALHALKDGHREKAVELLLRATVSSPENARYLADYGRVLAQCGRYREAAQVLQKAHQADPSEANQAALQQAESLAEAPPVRAQTSPAKTTAEGDFRLLALGPLPMEDEDASVDGEGHESNDARWSLAFEIERNWGTYDRFVEIATWAPSDGDPEPAPLCYLRGLFHYAKEEIEAAREGFRKAAVRCRQYGNADVYRFLLEDAARVWGVVEEMLEEGRSERQLLLIIEKAVGRPDRITPELRQSLLSAAMGLAGRSPTEAREKLGCFLQYILDCPEEDQLHLWQSAVERDESVKKTLLQLRAELFYDQGSYEEAREILEPMHYEDPADITVKDMLRSCEERLASEADTSVEAPAADPVPPPLPTGD